MKQQTQRLFTLAEANRTLPFVRRVTRDIVQTHRQICDLYAQWRKLVDDGKKVQAEEFELQIRDLLGVKEEFVGELEGIGCEFKSPQLGLVDFPARIGDRVVYLCWRLDEPEIRFWHDLSAGFAGRRSIDGHFA
jgi:hypothetical protein